MAQVVSALAWPMTAAALVLALVAEFVVARIAKNRARRRGFLWLSLWLLAGVLFVVSQSMLLLMRDESVLLVVQTKAQDVLGWILVIVPFALLGRYWSRSPRRGAGWRAMVCLGITLGFGILAAREARTFWLDAFRPPIRVEGSVARIWTEHTYFGKYHSIRKYVSIDGRRVEVTWDIYKTLEVGQMVAVDVGEGSGRVIAMSR